MTMPVLVPLPGNEAMAATLADALGTESFVPEIRRFPDDETYVRLVGNLQGRSVGLVCTLDRPDAKILGVIFAAETARALGAARVGLIAPYLSYMRQDRLFRPGEALTAKMFASLLSAHIDWMVTVDPHLHRIHALDEIFTVPTRALHASQALSRWIFDEVENPVLIGPDRESAQWVLEVANDARAGFVVLDKFRHGDRSVSVSSTDLSAWRSHTPVLVDDIVSTAGTMIEAMSVLREAGMRPAVCMAVHAIFAPGAYENLRAQSPGRIVTTNTVRHESNAIDISHVLALGIREVVAECR